MLLPKGGGVQLKRRWLPGYLLAPLVTALALVPWRVAGPPGALSSILLLLGAVMATSRYGGLGPGLLSGLLGALATLNFVLPAFYPLATTHLIAALELGGFVLVAFSISWLN